MASWGDFTSPDIVNQVSTWGTISSSNVQQHSLIMAYAAHYDVNGSAPTIKLYGVEHRILSESPSSPYRSYYPYYWYNWYFNRFTVIASRAYLYRYYYYGYYPWYYRNWRWWWYGRYHVSSNMVIAFADEAGTISMEALGDTFIAQQLKVWNTDITPATDKDVVEVAFQRSDLKPNWTNQLQGTMDVLTDDIVIMHGVDYTPSYASNSLSLGVLSTQTLFDTLSTYSTHAGGVRTKVVRVKADGVLEMDWAVAGAGVSAIRLTPNVTETNTVFPTVGTPKVYFEIQVIEDAQGDIGYPREFISLLSSLNYNTQHGIFRAWKREETAVQKDDFGRETFTGFKRVEIWAVPSSFESAVQQIPNVNIIEDLNELKARVLFHDKRW